MNKRLRWLHFFAFIGMWIFSSTSFAAGANHSITASCIIDTFPDDSSSRSIDTSLKYYLALGDSYTIGQSVHVNDRFPVQSVTMLRLEGYKMAGAEIIATSGWTTKDLWNAVSKTSFSYSYDFVTLLIGVNDQYRGRPLSVYQAEFTSLIQRSIQLTGNRPKRVFVVSIPDYSVTPFAGSSDKERIAREIDSFNRVNMKVAARYKVNYLNVTKESRKAATDPSLIAYDGLHFSGKEYTIWSELLTKMMKENIK